MKHLLLSILSLFSLNLFAQTRTQGDPSKAMPFLIEAEWHYQALDFERAYFVLENAVAHSPDSPEALIIRAKLKKTLGMQTEANMDYQKANRINPYVANLYGFNGNKGLRSLISFQPEISIKRLSNLQKLSYYYQTIDRYASTNNLTSKELQLLLNILTSIEANQLIEANKIIDETILEFPKSAIAYNLKGIVFTKNDDLKNAEIAFKKASILNPKLAISWYNLGSISLNQKKHSAAKNYFDKAILFEEDLSKAYFERAIAYKALGEPQKALNDYNKIVSLNGNMYTQAFLNRGLTKKMIGDYNGALLDFNQVIETDPLNAELWKNRANIFLMLGLHQNAIENYNEAIRLKNNTYAEAYFNRSIAYLQMFDKRSACDDLETSRVLGHPKALEMQNYFCTD